MRTLGCVLVLAVTALAGCLTDNDLDAMIDDIPSFTPQIKKVVQVDPDRWSGEPSILAMRDGTLLITGAAGMTRYIEDPMDIPGNAGASYIWRSTDGGETWAFVHLGLPEDLLGYRNLILGVEGDLAEDRAGTAYFTDLTFLVTNGVAASDDSGASWLAAQSPLVGVPGSDRPWIAATEPGVVYVKYLQVAGGHRVARSVDGGQTFLEDVALPACGQADMSVDRTTDEVLTACTSGGLSILRTPPGLQAWEQLPLRTIEAEPVNGSGSFVFPAMAVAQSGTYVFAWAQPTDEGAEVRISWSTDRGATWTPAVTLSPPGHTAVFPWVDANENGTVGVVWYQADRAGDPNIIEAEWQVMHASLRLRDADMQGLWIQAIREEPVHVGSICTSGLACVTSGRSDDRRLLDFFEVDVDDAGTSHITWTDTQTQVPTIWYGQVATAMS